MKHTNHTNAPDKSRISFQAAACRFIAIAVLASFLLTVMLIPRSSASGPAASEPAVSELPAMAARPAGHEQTIQPTQSTSGTRPVSDSLDEVLDEDQIWLLHAAASPSVPGTTGGCIMLTADGWRLNQFACPRSVPDANAAMIAAGVTGLF